MRVMGTIPAADFRSGRTPVPRRGWLSGAGEELYGFCGISKGGEAAATGPVPSWKSSTGKRR